MGMTKKQAAKQRFMDLLRKYRKAVNHLETPAERAEFAEIAVLLHAAKGHVPKRLWPLVGKAFRGE